MSDSIQVAIGIVDGKVVATWHQPTAAITFDPQNAYTVGMALSRAAMEAHRGSPADGDTQFIAGELAEVKVTVTDAQRDLMIGKVATILRTFVEQKRSPGYMAMHAVDAVLRETAR